MKKLFILGLVIYLAALISSLIIGQNTVILSGEYPFSFDYLGHITSILRDFQTNPSTLFSLASCLECPGFYAYSRWFALFEYILLAAGEVLGLHPFVFYIGISLLSEAIALYLLIKSLTLRFSSSAFILGYILFTLLPYKIRIISSGSMYHLHHAAFTLVIAGWFFCLADLKARRIRLSRLLLFSLSSALFLNVSINYLPILIYGLIILLIIYYRTLLTNLRYCLAWFTSTLLIFTGFNFPMVISLVISGNTHVYSSFNLLSLSDSLTAGMFGLSLVQSPAYSIVIMTFFITLAVLSGSSKLSLKHKLTLSILYFTTAWLVHDSPRLLSFLPLMSSLRSLHRFLYFQFLSLFLITYTGILNLRPKFLLPIFLVLVLPTLTFLYINKEFIRVPGVLIHYGVLPTDYFSAADYLDSLPGKKIYFPHYGVIFNGSMTGNYTWLDTKVPQNAESIHTNPFTTLFSVPGLIFTEGYQLDSPSESQLRALINFSGSATPSQISHQLSLLGIDYVIVDQYYNWANNFPSFPLNSFINLLTLDKQFGHLTIYRLPNSTNDCKKSYGNFDYGYCYNENPDVLINKSRRDFDLEKYVRTIPRELIRKSPAANIIESIVNPETRLRIIEEKILIPVPVFQAEGVNPDIFTKTLIPGTYQLNLPILKFSDSDRLFKNSRLLIKLNNISLKSISPYSDKPGIFWEQLDIVIQENSLLSIETTGNGWIIFGQPILLDSLSSFP